jgi:hypothetical protein
MEKPMATTTVDYAGQVLTDVREQIAADDDVLKEARDRRNLITKHARDFDGALKSFNSGSVAHGTVNKPVSDADAGIVLDRRKYPQLGPDGDDEPPNAIVEEVAEYVIERVREDYPHVTKEITKRAILFEFHEPFESGEDPSVDLVITLTKAEGNGRWIPNTEAEDWDPSDPEEHTRLLTDLDRSPRVHRARVIRLGKAAIKQDETPVVSSFNIEALALEHVDCEGTIAESLRDLFLDGADSLEEGPTEDPAKVSDPIKLPEGISQDRAAARLREFGEAVAKAVEADCLADAEDALRDVFPDYIDSGAAARTLGDALRNKRKRETATAFAITAAEPELKPTRSFGDAAR